MVNTILSVSIFTLALAILAMYRSHRQMKKAFEVACDSIAGNYACLDWLREEADKSHDALQFLINQHDKHMIMSRYNLANTRLSFSMHQQAAVKAEDFEGAANLAQAISNIEHLLQEDEE